MNIEEFRECVCHLLEKAGYEAEPATQTVEHTPSWREEKIGFVVNGVFVDPYISVRKKKWYIRIMIPMAERLYGNYAWVCRGGKTELAAKRLCNAILEHLPAFDNADKARQKMVQEREQQEAIVAAAKDTGVVCRLIDYGTPTVHMSGVTTSLNVAPDKLTEEFRQEWLQLQANLETLFTEFKRSFNIL